MNGCREGGGGGGGGGRVKKKREHFDLNSVLTNNNSFLEK